MQGRRTYTTRIRLFLMVVLLGLAADGYVRFPDIPFRLKPSDRFTLKILTRGTFATPYEMTCTVTLPLESALSRIRAIAEVRSETTENLSSIMLTFHRKPERTEYNQLLQVLRENAVRFPAHTTYPVLENDREFTEGLVVLVWLESGQESIEKYHATLSGLIRSVPRTLQVSSNRGTLLPADSRSAFIPVSKNMHGLLSAVASGNSFQNPVFFRGHPLDASHFIHPEYPEASHRSTANSYTAMPMIIRPAKNTNVLWWRGRMLHRLDQLSKYSRFRYYVSNDPWHEVEFTHLPKAVLLFFLFIGLVIRSAPSTPTRIICALVFPGIYFFLLSCSGQGLAPLSLLTGEYLWLICLLLMLTVRDKVSAVGIYGVMMIWLCLLLLAGKEGVSGEWTALAQTLITGLPALVLSILPCAGFHWPVRPQRSAFPWIAGLIFFTAAIACMLEWVGLPDWNLLRNLRENQVPYPPDKSSGAHELILQARKTPFTPLTNAGPDSVVSLLDQLDPGLLLFGKVDESYRISVHWASITERQVLEVREAIKPLLLSQTGIRWTMEGTGGFFQNEREIFPGRYQLELAGTDFMALLRTARKAGDSIQSLPGTSQVWVNQDPFAASVLYRFESGNDQSDWVGSLWKNLALPTSIPDTASFFRRPYFGERQTFSLHDSGNLKRIVQSAPVRRSNGRYIIPLAYAHYAGEKYARRFYRHLMASLSKSLPPGMEVITTDPGLSGGSSLRIFGVMVLVICLAIQPLGGNKTTLITNLTAILGVVVFLFYQHYQYAFSTMAACLLLFAVLLFLLHPAHSIKSLVVCGGIWAACEATGIFLSPFGKQQADHMLMCWLVIAGAGWYALSLGWSVSGRGERFQKLFDFIRLGVITKFVK